MSYDDRPLPADHQAPAGLRRRDALVAAGGLGLAAALTPWGRLTATADAATTTCILSPEVTAGPYWVKEGLTRRNVTEGKPGIPLLLDLTVLDAKTCKAITGADVEIWHADAGGVYSAFDKGGSGPGQAATSSTRYLRGHQKSDARGALRFVTIYPGWYRGRTTHIHLKVSVGGHVVHTGQLFMPQTTTAAVYRTAHYKARGQADTTNAADNIFRQAGGSKAQLKLTHRSAGGYRGTIALGVAT